MKAWTMPFQPGNKLGKKLQPGEVRNPHGRHGPLIRDYVRRISDEVHTVSETGEVVKKGEHVARLMWDRVLAGDQDAVKWWAEQNDGKLPQGITLQEDIPVEVLLAFMDARTDELPASSSKPALPEPVTVSAVVVVNDDKREPA